jgi:hypothetical protein
MPTTSLCLLLFVITDYQPRVSTAGLSEDVHVNSPSRFAPVLRISGITAPANSPLNTSDESLVVCLRLDNPQWGARILQANE